MDTLVVVLGDELQAVRKRKKWTRRDLQRRLPFDVSLQTIATWELGTRHISAERLVLVCDALGEPAEELIARARMRVAGTGLLGPEPIGPQSIGPQAGHRCGCPCDARPGFRAGASVGAMPPAGSSARRARGARGAARHLDVGSARGNLQYQQN